MKNKLTIALLLAAVYLFSLLFSAPARLLTLALPDGARLGETTGTLWQGEARQASWRGFDIAHLRWSLAFRRGFPAGISRLTTPPACAARPGCTV
ncbi:type II secretion system protein N [Klebsiella michiganensis]|nr:type II secretion system protein N [Klebsiella michiganensis]